MAGFGGGAVFGSHRAHPGELMDHAAVTALRRVLILAGHTPAAHKCS